MKTLILLNLVVGLVFGWFVLRTQLTDLDVCMNYTELDRAGVIDLDALADFDKRLASDDHRNLVPRWIASPALSAQRTNAILGLLLAFVNAVGLGFVNWKMRNTAVTLSESIS